MDLKEESDIIQHYGSKYWEIGQGEYVLISGHDM
jgi:hypothetical protein